MYRGSKSEDASAYKLEGHAKERVFADLIGGSTQNLPPQGKTDCIGPGGEKYSVKKHAKKWQVFLYGIDRLLRDPGFISLSEQGLDLSRLLKAFPDDYEVYLRDKEQAKKRMRSLLASEASGFNLGGLIETLSKANSYIQSKLQLSKANNELHESLKEKAVRQALFRKALFNDDEVDYLALEDGNDFHILKSEEVVEIFAHQTTVHLSGTGGHRDDISIPGQKILLKKDTNLVELEVRNDSSSHYRQLRFNMIRDVAVKVLLENSTVISRDGRLVRRGI